MRHIVPWLARYVNDGLEHGLYLLLTDAVRKNLVPRNVAVADPDAIARFVA
jgi:hypothetical protein